MTTATAARIAGPDFQRLEAQISAKRDQLSDHLRDAEAAVRKAERGVSRRQRRSAPTSTTRERRARETLSRLRIADNCRDGLQPARRAAP